ncbi:fibroblast growth factor receptor 4-like [Pocillopora verrucosa]|uniref:fibroblast growth factor receptor 4-like n=1 Tax=Pocillopora verrucosa TaxID=203993 RepID=UPI00333E18E9
MLKTHWLRDARNCLLLLLVTSALGNLPSAETTKKCNTKAVIPEINISSSPPSRTLFVREALNLTCIAWPKSEDELLPRRRIKYIQWYDPQNSPVGVICIGSQQRKKLRCTLMLKGLTLAQFGNYTCEAENYYVGYCRRKTVEIGQAFLAPETVEDPKNQTVVAGFNLSLNCTAEGSPMPSIAWIKNNDSLAIQSNPRIKYIKTVLDYKQIHSQLVIEDAKKKDEGKYHCVANNTVGENASNPAFLSIEDLAPETVEDPKNQTVVAGFNVTLNCTAKGSPMPSITWIKNNDPLAIQSNPRIKYIKTALDDKQIHSQLVIEDVKKEDKGKYHCVANNTVGEKASNPAFLSIEDLDNWARTVEDPVNQTSGPYKTAFFGSNVTFNCSAAGLPKPNITWVKNNNSNAANSNPRARVIPILLEIIQSQLSIREVKEEDDGKNYCVKKSSAGEIASKYAFLFIKQLAKVSLRKDRHRSVSMITALSVFGGTIMTVMCGCTVAFFYRRAGQDSQGNRDEGELYVVCMANKDLAEGIAEDENHNENGSATLVVNNVAPLVDDEKQNTNMRPKGKDPTQDKESVDSMLLEGSKIPTPPDVGEKNFRNPIFDQKDQAEKLLNSRSGYLSAQDGRNDVNVIPHQDSGMDSYKRGDQMLTSLNTALEEECAKDVDDLEVLEEVLGEGEYGIVYKGRCGRKNGNVIDVAVKKLKDDASALEKAALLNEIRTLKQAGRHPNIVNLIGAWVRFQTVFVVTELVRGGSLESLLKSKDDGSNEYANVCCKLSDRQLLNIALQVALGMQHLEERKCIHRDLAARNVFIDSSKVAKVGDFGLARNISDDGLYIKTSCVKIPWRWSSLESLRDRVYTSKSDVWSFGILLSEIATHGELPYPDIESPLSLVSRLSTGYRMPRPHECSEELYTLMSSCWNENPLMRPSFTDIVNELEYLLREVKRTYINIMEDEITSRVDLK